MRHGIDLTLIAAALALSAGSALADKPRNASNNSWITVSGEITDTADDAFTLKYGAQSIPVEIGDMGWYSDGRQMLEGQNVTVTGMIDDDLFERRSIEARSVYVDSLNTYYYASAADEEDSFYPYGDSYYYGDVDVDSIALTGTVENIIGRQFKLDTGSRAVTIDTSTMSYNPLDGEGYHRVGEGDRVRVTGSADTSIFDLHEVDASTLVTLSSS